MLFYITFRLLLLSSNIYLNVKKRINEVVQINIYQMIYIFNMD